MAEIITQQSERVTGFLSRVDRLMESLNKLSAVQPKRQLGNEVFITDAELCEKLKVGDRTTQQWRSDGKIEYIQFAEHGGKVLYRESDVQKFIERYFVKAWSEPKK